VDVSFISHASWDRDTEISTRGNWSCLRSSVPASIRMGTTTQRYRSGPSFAARTQLSHYEQFTGGRMLPQSQNSRVLMACHSRAFPPGLALRIWDQPNRMALPDRSIQHLCSNTLTRR
jgi:hypothetical protein